MTRLKLLVMLMGISALGGQGAMGQANPDCSKLLIDTRQIAADNITQMERDCSLDDTLDLLCKSGRVCERVGHQWQSGVHIGYGTGIIVDPAVMGAAYRYCVICHKEQVRNTDPGWRDEP